jgi:hypothetical protein
MLQLEEASEMIDLNPVYVGTVTMFSAIGGWDGTDGTGVVSL